MAITRTVVAPFGSRYVTVIGSAAMPMSRKATTSAVAIQISRTAHFGISEGALLGRGDAWRVLVLSIGTHGQFNDYPGLGFRDRNLVPRSGFFLE